MINSRSKKAKFLAVIVAALIIYTAIVIDRHNKEEERLDPYRAGEFSGEIVFVSDNSIFAFGKFSMPKGSRLKAPIINIDTELVVNPDTKFIKELIFVPKDYNPLSDGPINVSGLRKERVNGSFEELRDGDFDGVIAKPYDFGISFEKFPVKEVRYFERVEE